MPPVAGFDPGRPGKFGWCVAFAEQTLPVEVLELGSARYAGDAVAQVLKHTPAGTALAAVAIDAPLLWVASGSRESDLFARRAIRDLGAPNAGGTVQEINSLRGACLVQGLMAAMLLREALPSIIVTESHPKVILWLLGHARPSRRAVSVELRSIPELRCSGLCSEDERDAAVACLSAWAALFSPPAWRDFATLDTQPLSPLDGPIAYWLPQRLPIDR
jgi:predicted nuclease with RNAse H fold